VAIYTYASKAALRNTLSVLAKAKAKEGTSVRDLVAPTVSIQWYMYTIHIPGLCAPT
jgi:hypothetical protein